MEKKVNAIVVFHDCDSHPFSRFLKKGFRHCFVCVKSHPYWIRINYLGSHLETQVDCEYDFNLVDYYREMGYTVVETQRRINRGSEIHPFSETLMISNCVGVAKIVLGINSFSWTPYQLYKELTQ